MKLVTILLLLVSAQAFCSVGRPKQNISPRLFQSDQPRDTEDLLLEYSKQKALGLKQEYGETIKKDGLDGVRKVVWGIFRATEIVFPALGGLLTVGLFLNLLGYGYELTPDHGLVVQSLEAMRTDKQLQAAMIEMAGGL